MGYFSKRHKIRVLKEFARKTFHVLAGLFVIIGFSELSKYSTKETAMFAVYALLIAYIFFESLRLSYAPYITKLISKLLRKREYTKPSTSIDFLISFIIVFSIAREDVALAAFFMLVFGDMIAAVFGTLFGKTKLWYNKTYVGTIAGLAANLIVGYLVLNGDIKLFIPMAIVASTVELFTIKLDDNLTIPLVTGFVGQLLVVLI